jgi:hypothetical protein
VHHLPVSKTKFCNCLFRNFPSITADPQHLIDEACSHLSAYINSQNIYHWDNENPCYSPHGLHYDLKGGVKCAANGVRIERPIYF